MHGEGAEVRATGRFPPARHAACRGASHSGVPAPRVRFRSPGCHAGSCHNSPRTGSVKLCNWLLLQLCDSNTLRYIVLAPAGAARHISMHVNTAATRARNGARDELRGAMELPAVNLARITWHGLGIRLLVLDCPCPAVAVSAASVSGYARAAGVFAHAPFSSSRCPRDISVGSVRIRGSRLRLHLRIPGRECVRICLQY
jgi:hypothetical protein